MPKPHLASLKSQRHYAIKEIVGALSVANQDDLKRVLKKRGIDVTQATLSRDMKEIGIVWVSAPGGGKYSFQPEEEVRFLQPTLGAQVHSIVANEYTIVIHTLPGCAGVVAEFIDVRRSTEIIGTIAGDNTVLVIPRSIRRTTNVLEFLKSILIRGSN